MSRLFGVFVVALVAAVVFMLGWRQCRSRCDVNNLSEAEKNSVQAIVSKQKATNDVHVARPSCVQQPWKVGCRQTAHESPLGLLSTDYLAHIERASVLPGRGRYLVISLGGGFGNQLSELSCYALAALLTNRILVVVRETSHILAATNETDAALSFDLRRYFQSSAFPYHGSPSILSAIAAAEAQSSGSPRIEPVLSFARVPCASCPKKMVDERTLLAELGKDVQVVRTFDFESHYTSSQPAVRWQDLLSAAHCLKLPSLKSISQPSAAAIGPVLFRLLLEPTAALQAALAPFKMPTQGAFGVHVRTGDASMIAAQASEPRNVKDGTGWQSVYKCGVRATDPKQRDALLNCVSKLAANRPIFFASDTATLAAEAKQRFGSQMLPSPPGQPVHTFRTMDKLHNVTLARDPHLKQMLDFVLLGSTPSLMTTCGSFGGGARIYSEVLKQGLSYHGRCP